jgi:hypothetical protein
MTFAAIAVGVGLVVGAGASIYATNKQGQIANSQLSLAQDQQYKEDTSFNQLQELMQNPGNFFSSPVYQASAAQGTQAVARANAAGSGPNSGNEATALQTFGQSFGQQQLLGQEQLLAGMSGTGFNPAGAGTAASGAASAAAGGLNSLAGLLAFFGTSGVGASSASSTGGIGAGTDAFATPTPGYS